MEGESGGGEWRGEVEGGSEGGKWRGEVEGGILFGSGRILG